MNEELSNVSIKLKVQRTFNIQLKLFKLDSAKCAASSCVMICHILDNTRKFNLRVWPDDDSTYSTTAVVIEVHAFMHDP